MNDNYDQAEPKNNAVQMHPDTEHGILQRLSALEGEKQEMLNRISALEKHCKPKSSFSFSRNTDKQLDKLQEKKKKLEEELQDCKEELQKRKDIITQQSEEYNTVKNAKEMLEDQLRDKKNQYSKLENKYNSACTQHEAALERLKKTTLDEQDELFAIASLLKALPDDVRIIAKKYFALDNLVIFLARCGEIGFLKELWKQAAKETQKESKQTDEKFFQLLRRILDIHNDTTSLYYPLISPDSGDKYNPELHERISSDGTIIKSVLLPGLGAAVHHHDDEVNKAAIKAQVILE